jgi:hypothetical protein
MPRADSSENLRRHVSEWIGHVAAGETINIDLTLDVDGARLPPRMTIQDIVIAPSASTIFRLRIFSRATRVAAINANHNLIYERAFPAVASADLVQLRDQMSYVDDDAIDAREYNLGTIWMTIEVQAAANPSAFMIHLFYGTV